MTIDYSRHAAEYDRARADDVVDQEFWLRGLLEVGGILPGASILDLGAGTGRFAKLLSATNPVAALDASREMLRVAQGKGSFASVQGDAHQLPFKADAFDVTVMVMVLHHLADPPAALREVARVSRRAVVVTSDMSTRRLGIIEEAFPSLLDIDRRRFPPIASVVASLRAAGFRDVRQEARAYSRSFTVLEQLDRVRRRYLSTFDLLPAGEYERGKRFLEMELPQRYPGGFEVAASFTFLAGTR